MIQINLHGRLGEVVGASWKLAADSVADALRGIEANSGKLYKHLTETSDTVEYRILINGKDHEHHGDLLIPRNIREIDLVPVPQGSGGLWQTIIGVVLIVVAVVLIASGVGAAGGATILGLSAAASAQVVTTTLLVGISLTLGGVAQMMTKTPQLNSALPSSRAFDATSNNLQTGVDQNQGGTQKPSYLFSGVANTVSQGNCVPVGYGRVFAGSQLIGIGLFNAKLPATMLLGEPPRGGDYDYPFEQEPIWNILSNHAIVADIKSLNDFKKRTMTETMELYTRFLLHNVPTNPWPSLKKMRATLDTVYFLFKGPRIGKITKKEAYDLHQLLHIPPNNGWVTITNPDDPKFGQSMLYADTALTKERIIMEVGIWYEANI